MTSRVDRLSGSVLEGGAPTRRSLLAGATASLVLPCSTRAAQPFRFGLTPVFLTSDLQLLEALQHYLTVAMGVEVQLVLKRTYQEITSQLLSGLLDAAWICGFPFVAYRRELDLVAVPVWRGKPTYQSYLLVSADREAANSPWNKAITSATRAASSSIGRQVANEIGKQVFGTSSRSSSSGGGLIGSVVRGVLGGLFRR